MVNSDERLIRRLKRMAASEEATARQVNKREDSQTDEHRSAV